MRATLLLSLSSCQGQYMIYFVMCHVLYLILSIHLCGETCRLSSVVNPDARPHRLANIAKTWGPSSHAIYVVHSATEYPEGGDISVATTYPKLLVVPNHIGVDQGVARLEHVIRTVYNEINPDFGFFVNDHTFVLPFNLCQFVQNLDSSQDLYAGHALKGKDEVAFNSGAAGYLLSRSTMTKLIKEWDNPNSKCVAANASKWLQGNPGILMAECFERVLNIPVTDTRDEDDLSHKFHAYGIVRTVTAKFDDWYLNKHKTLDDVLGVDTKYHHQLQEGENCCSTGTISFHYVEAAESLALWDVLQTIHQSPFLSDAEIKEYMYKIWPTDKEGLGFYAHVLPDPQLAIWNDLTQVVRKIRVGMTPPSC